MCLYTVFTNTLVEQILMAEAHFHPLASFVNYFQRDEQE